MVKKIGLLILLVNIVFAQAGNEQDNLMTDRIINKIATFNTLYNPELAAVEPLTVKINIYETENNINENIRNNVLYAAFDVMFIVFSQANIDELHLLVNVELLKGVRFDENNYSYSQLRDIEKKLKGFSRKFVIKKSDLYDFLRENNIIVISSVINKDGSPGKDYERLKFYKSAQFLNHYTRAPIDSDY